MADFWPIENICAIVKEKTGQDQITNQNQMRKAIVRAWKSIDQDKELCQRLMKSIPRRAAAIIERDGAQTFKGDY